jgi:hypothetical protein
MYPLPDTATRSVALGRPRLTTGGRIVSALAAALGAIVLGGPMLAEAGPAMAPRAWPMGCRAVHEQVQCSIAVSFNPVEGASYYTATLTTPGGASIPYGQVGTGSASLSFAYAGDGAYTVGVQAWGVSETGEPVEQASENAGADVADEAPGEGTPDLAKDTPDAGGTAPENSG